MASRLAVDRATTHIQLCFLYAQDLVASGVVRPRKFDTKHNLTGLSATTETSAPFTTTRARSWLLTTTPVQHVHRTTMSCLTCNT